MIERLGDLYVSGRITVEELEHRLEPALLREAPLGTPVPDGWQPLPCEHLWLDVTVLGERAMREICTRCGDERSA